MNINREELFADLTYHKERLQNLSMQQLFVREKQRFTHYSILACDILLDFSKNLIDKEALEALFDVARKVNIEQRRSDMINAKPINLTENRPALHMALRYRGKKKILVNNQNIMDDVEAVLKQMEHFSNGIISGDILGAEGDKFTDIVNIGIGGSDLGPQMVTKALKPYHKKGLRAHFISNIDGSQIADLLLQLNPKTTLFIVASKSFTTDETMTNARTARQWLVDNLGKKAIKAHFVAISTNLSACSEFGIKEEHIFIFWDWVGGRYSIWSSIGLIVSIMIGFENFIKFLHGAYLMDKHFLNAPIEKNMPIILALIGIFYRNIWNFPTLAIVPYDQRLSRFAPFLQQLDMESNGKSVSLSGKRIKYKTGPIVWGEVGTNSQHAFFQLLHQGTDIVPTDFLLAANSHEDLPEHHNKLVANCLAQSRALMIGKNLKQVKEELRNQGLNKEQIEKLAPHKIFAGNRPSNTIFYPKLTPQILGSLIALYEHKIFTQAIIWNINPFDQWGVELGKELAKNIWHNINSDKAGKELDASTAGLLAYFNQNKK